MEPLRLVEMRFTFIEKQTDHALLNTLNTSDTSDTRIYTRPPFAAKVSFIGA